MKPLATSIRSIAILIALIAGTPFVHQSAISENLKPTADPKTTNADEVSPAGPDELTSDLPIKKTNDPFANTMEMLRKVTHNNPVASTISALTGSMDMRLRGAVIDDDGQSLALLEFAQGQVHVVKVGDTVSLKTHGKNSSVKIMAIHRQSVELEFGDFDEYVVVR